MEQDGEIYYLAKSPDLPGLIVEAESLAEMIKIAPLVAEDLIEAKKERLAKQSSQEVIRKKPFQFSLNFNKLVTLSQIA
ncbi:MAG: hypothetical protein LBU27_07940 [Candidatus Peribacteria bacterium]|nr:hypothetical protein [Candidatus Peribacteria bacterium]